MSDEVIARLVGAILVEQNDDKWSVQRPIHDPGDHDHIER